MDACNGAFSAAKTCPYLPNHWRRIGSKVGSSCIAEAVSQLIFIFVSPVLSKEPDIDGDK